MPPSGPNEIAQLMVHFNHLGLSLMERTSSLESQREGYRQYLSHGTTAVADKTRAARSTRRCRPGSSTQG